MHNQNKKESIAQTYNVYFFTYQKEISYLLIYNIYQNIFYIWIMMIILHIFNNCKKTKNLKSDNFWTQNIFLTTQARSL